MLSGYCGTLMTPMAANFNLVPVALLELDDPYAVIRAQWATALPLMVLDGRGATPRMLKPFMSVVMMPKLWLVLLPAYWVARNLPWWPFTWLAPG